MRAGVKDFSHPQLTQQDINRELGGKVEQTELELAPTWDANIAGRDIAYYTRTSALFVVKF